MLLKLRKTRTGFHKTPCGRVESEFMVCDCPTCVSYRHSGVSGRSSYGSDNPYAGLIIASWWIVVALITLALKHVR